MTIRAGVSWGEHRPLPPGSPVCRSDAELAALVAEHRRSGRELPTVGLLGGDLCRTVGGTGDPGRLSGASAVTLPVDVGAALVDGRLHWFVAHVVARRSWWSGRVVAVMNAEWIGAWDVAPRAHPNDGRLDVLDGVLPPGDRLKARSRLRTGTHVPHPALREERTKACGFDFARALDVRLDGVRVGRARTLSVRVEADALRVVV